MQAHHPHRLTRLWTGLILLAVFLVYAPSLRNQFALDDGIVARATLPNGAANQMTARLRPLEDYFLNGYWVGNDGQLSPLYRPVTVLSYALTNGMTGGLQADPEWEAFPHHLLNVLLQVLATWLVLCLVRPLVTQWWHAGVAAAVFGMHGIHSEVVAGIVGRAELFGFCFGSAALLLFVGGLRNAGAKQGIRMAASSLCLFLAFGSKESAVAWAPFLLLYAWIRNRDSGMQHRQPGRIGLQVLAVSLLPALGFFWLRAMALAEVPSPFPIDPLANPLFELAATTRWYTAMSVWGFALVQCVLPWNLVSDYGPMTFDLIESPWNWKFLVSTAALLLALGYGVRSYRERPLVFLAVASFFGFSVLISNLVFPIGTVFGERLYYTPSLGLALATAWLAGRVRRPQQVLIPLVVWTLASTLVIVDRNAAWYDETTLFVADAQANPRCLRLLDAYAGHLERINQHDAAEASWRQALSLDPEYVDALSGLAGFMARRGHFEESETLYQKALLAPQGLKAVRHITHYNLALTYQQLQKPKQAEEQLRMAWRRDAAYELLHEPLLLQSQAVLAPEEMEEILERGRQRWPDHPTWPLQRGYLALAYKDPKTALGYLRRAYQLRPGHPQTRWVLAATLLQTGDKTGAKPLLESLRKDKAAPPEIRNLARTALREAY